MSDELPTEDDLELAEERTRLGIIVHPRMVRKLIAAARALFAIRDSFDERAAISEAGGLPRPYAEVLAALQTMPIESLEGVTREELRQKIVDAAARFLDKLNAENSGPKP